ncbi:MAG: reverse transcriptase family protein, partial [Planctomycetaceae bacterium]|nr:reverse transcriptase family protein [Planctomycetaceae bacterium]
MISAHKEELKPLNLVFIDVKKAFDSVSHDSVLKAVYRLGVPDPLLTYLHEYYVDCSTIFTVANQSSDAVRTSRGVRQGDPLSGYLFNMVVDWALEQLDSSIGINVGEIKISNLAYADDVVLFSSTPRGLQQQLDTFCSHLAESGLLMSAGYGGKSASLGLVIDGKKKKYLVNNNPFLKIQDEIVPALNPSKPYKYLGINISSLGTKQNIKQILDTGLKELTEAPLKPQQRLFLLSTFLIPKLYHQLILCNTTTSTLKWLDNSIRSSARTWLRLPKDTPRAFFHAKTCHGGLQIPLLTCKIPLLTKQRFENIILSDDPAIQHLQSISQFRKIQAKASKPIHRWKRTPITSKEALNEEVREDLVTTVDGCGLAHRSEANLHSL